MTKQGQRSLGHDAVMPLTALPVDLLARIALALPSALDAARLHATSRLFSEPVPPSAPGGEPAPSVIEQALRRRAMDRRVALPTALPEGETWARQLCFEQMVCEASPPAVIVAGSRHSLFICRRGRLLSCGSERVEDEPEESEADGAEPDEGSEAYPGLLGHGAGVVMLTTLTLLPSSLLAVTTVAAGSGHSAAITTDGTVWSWGHGTSGKLGHGDEANQYRPKPIAGFAGGRVCKIAAGDHHCLAIDSNHEVWSWGHGGDGALGHGDKLRQLCPKRVERFSGQRVCAIAAGSWNSYAITASGSLFTWGLADGGCLGHGDLVDVYSPKQVEAFASRRVCAVAGGALHSLAATTDGAAWSWGYGASFALGHGDDAHQMKPKQIAALAGERVVAVAAGTYHSLARTAGGEAWSWGGGDYGVLGHGDEANRPLPRRIEALCGVRALAAGASHTFALTGDDDAWSWGRGDGGALGHGDRYHRSRPKQLCAKGEQLCLECTERVCRGTSYFLHCSRP